MSLNEENENIKKIFVIDDEEDNLIVFDLMFKSIEEYIPIKYQLFLIKYGTLDLSCVVPKVNPDIIFLDEKLPESSGVEILDKMRLLGYKKPIVVQTSSVTNYEMAIYKEIFTDGVLIKPIDEDCLIGMLEKHGIIEERTTKSQ
jgi:CheY-like chemotaxis protein